MLYIILYYILYIRYINHNVSFKAVLANYYLKPFVALRKVDPLLKLLEKLLVLFAISLAGLLVYNVTKAD